MKRERGELESLGRPEDRLVGEVDHDGGVERRGKRPQRLGRRHPAHDRPAVVRLRVVEHPGAHLLLAAAEDHPGDSAAGLEAVERVPHRGGMVLAVDQHEGRSGYGGTPFSHP